MIVSLVISDHSWFAKTIIINISSDICQDFVKQQFLLYGLFEYLKSDQKWNKKYMSIFLCNEFAALFLLDFKNRVQWIHLLTQPQCALNYQ